MEPEDSVPCLQEPTTEPILSQTNPIHVLTLCFFKIYFNIVLPPMPISSKWSLPLGAEGN
jgi:hypothetical protein